MRPVRLPFVIAAAVVWACSSATSPNSAQVIIQNFSYSPSNLTIKEGTTVTWVNLGPSTHTVTGDSLQYDSGNISSGGSYQLRFDHASATSYHCTLHPPSSYPSFRGTITVTR